MMDGNTNSTATENSASGIIPVTASQLPKKKPEDFRFGKLIGEGSFSSVYLAKEVKTGDEFAIKVCNKQHIIRERKIELIKREKEVMAILSGNRNPKAPFFVRLYATFHDAERLYFVMTFGCGGELLKYLHKVGSFDTACCRFYCGELLLGLAHLHKLRIVHRDLKPENILLDHRGHVLITDFGSAKILKSENEKSDTRTSTASASSGDAEAQNRRGIRSSSFVGSAPYVSPEVLQGKYSLVGPSADLWAFGCILYQFVSGLPPFHGPNEYLIFQKIIKLDYQFPPGFDSDAKDLVGKLLVTDHLGRLGAKDDELYVSIQSHQFFQDMSWDTLPDQEAPLILPYLPSTSVGPPLRSQISDSLEPGFNPRIMAERAIRDDDDDDFPKLGWSDGTGASKSTAIDSDEDDEDEESISLSSLLIDKGNISFQTNQVESSSELRKQSTSSKDKPKYVTVTAGGTRNVLPANESEKQLRLAEQIKKNPWNSTVNGKLILKQGVISKRKGLFSRRRMLLLTEGPQLIYCEPNRMTVKGEIPWSAALNPEPKDFRTFFIHTPNRTYYMEDSDGYALDWCKAIDEVRFHVYGETPKSRIPMIQT